MDGDLFLQQGDVSSALRCYLSESEEHPLDWWPSYRAAWCFNLLDKPDSAAILAQAALALAPCEERCLGELLKSVSHDPERVLQYDYLVSGGGVCRYRLARAEIDTGDTGGESVLWLLNEFDTGDSASAADAGCWLSILFPEKGTLYIERSVALAPHEVFYRCLYIERLVDSGLLARAEQELALLSETCEENLNYWQAAASLYEAEGDPLAAIEASGKAYSLRQVPSTGADLGWRLYFHGRDLVRENRISEAVPFLYQCSDTWSPESSWALRADSLLDLMNEFTSVSDGFGEPL